MDERAYLWLIYALAIEAMENMAHLEMLFDDLRMNDGILNGTNWDQSLS